MRPNAIHSILLSLAFIPASSGFQTNTPTTFISKHRTHVNNHHYGNRVWSSTTPTPLYATNNYSDKDQQGTKVFGGLRLLEWTNQLLPQSLLVKSAKTSWNLIWKTMMAELAPQSSDGR